MKNNKKRGATVEQWLKRLSGLDSIPFELDRRAWPPLKREPRSRFCKD